ncbi:hypothetical protein [Amycolatopsis sp. cg9]|uniref:hypothetical protein n=1 Tax=Amycolatopsis sp. cg9 TaxID=3238801 RepID=UPI003526B8D6
MSTTTTPARRRTHVVAAVLAGGTITAAALLAACGHPVAAPPAAPTVAYVGVCVDPVTHWRVADTFCGGADPYTGAALSRAGYLWDYYPPSYTGVIAAYNQPVIGVPIIHTVPVATSTTVVVIDRGASPSGGSITSVRASAAAAHNQATVPARTTTPTTASTKPAATTAPPTSAARTTAAAPTRNPAITRGGFGVSTRTR